MSKSKILYLVICILVIIGLFYFFTRPEKSYYQKEAIKSNEVKKDFAEAKTDLYLIELKDVFSQISFTYNAEFKPIKKDVFYGSITNKSKATIWKNFRVRIYFIGTKPQESMSFTIYKSVLPGQTIQFSQILDAPKKTNSITMVFDGAEHERSI